MIYFTIPSSTGLVGVDTDILIDREPSSSSSLNLLTYGNKDTGNTQYAANGINIRDEMLSIQIKNLPAETAIIINTYFTRLKNNNLTIVFPEGSKNYQIDNWSVTIKNLIYADITASLELMYL